MAEDKNCPHCGAEYEVDTAGRCVMCGSQLVKPKKDKK